MTEPEPLADPLPYLLNAVAAMEAAGIEVIGDGYDPGTPVRSRGFGLEGAFDLAMLGHDGDIEEMTFTWHEEIGWTIATSSFTGALRANANQAFDLGLGVVPEPAVLAAEMVEIGRDPAHNLRYRGGGDGRVRRAAAPDPELEAALRSYSPSRGADPVLLDSMCAALTTFAIAWDRSRPLAPPDELAEGEYGSLIRLDQLWMSVEIDGTAQEIQHANLEWRSVGGWSLFMGVWLNDEMREYRAVRHPLDLAPDAGPVRVAQVLKQTIHEIEA